MSRNQMAIAAHIYNNKVNRYNKIIWRFLMKLRRQENNVEKFIKMYLLKIWRSPNFWAQIIKRYKQFLEFNVLAFIKTDFSLILILNGEQ